MATLVRTTTKHPHFEVLVGLLEAELRERYGVIQELYAPYNKVVDMPNAVVVYINEEPAGCGCFKVYDNSTVEIKRMYVALQHRGNGLAGSVLYELEHWARELGYTKAILETGARQPESLRLYEKSGYQPIPNYEPYMDMVESICYSKKL